MSPFKDKCLELYLYNYVHATEEKVDKTPKLAVESAVEFQIPFGHVKKVMEEPFSGDGSKSAMDHLDFIETLCSLFKLAGIPQNTVNIKLVYLSFSGNARLKMHFFLLYLVDLSYILLELKLVYLKRKCILNVQEKS